jgi:hypothetical protein
MDRRPSTPGHATAAAVTLLAAVLSLSLILAAPATANAPTTVAPGVTFQTVYEKDIKSHVYILRLDPSKGASLKAVPAGDQLPSQATVVDMLQGVHAVAGINGDLLDRYRHSPAQAFATAGELLQTRTDGNVDRLLGITSPGVIPRVGKTAVQITLSDPASGSDWSIDLWNPGRDPGMALGHHEVAGYTSYGGKVASPPGNACSARLTHPSDPHWADDKHAGVTRTWTVDSVACAKSPMPLGGGMVLAALRSGSEAADVRALSPGTTVSVTWSLKGWKGVTGTIGGNRLIVSGGEPTVGPHCHTYLCSNDSRTGIGQADNGTIMLVVVDKGIGSRGVTLYQFAKLFQQLGAKDALNLDGDGSSHMWVKGKTVNVPGDPNRHVSSALAILAGPDPDVHIGAPLTLDATGQTNDGGPTAGDALIKARAKALATVAGALTATATRLAGGAG